MEAKPEAKSYLAGLCYERDRQRQREYTQVYQRAGVEEGQVTGPSEGDVPGEEYGDEREWRSNSDQSRAVAQPVRDEGYYCYVGGPAQHYVAARQVGIRCFAPEPGEYGSVDHEPVCRGCSLAAHQEGRDEGHAHHDQVDGGLLVEERQA